MCSKHYNRFRKHGDPNYVSRHFDPLEKFLASYVVDANTGCHVWSAGTTSDGYGSLWVRGAAMLAHRFAYVTYVRELSREEDLDHRCRNRLCVNTDHLRVATNQQNHENRSRTNPHSASGRRGVSWNSARAKWCGQVGHKGKRYYVGLFDTVDEADDAVTRKRMELCTYNEEDLRVLT